MGQAMCLQLSVPMRRCSRLFSRLYSLSLYCRPWMGSWSGAHALCALISQPSHPPSSWCISLMAVVISPIFAIMARWAMNSTEKVRPSERSMVRMPRCHSRSVARRTASSGVFAPLETSRNT